MKQDPVFVDPDAEARARLKAMQGGGGPALPFKTAQDELRELEERERKVAAQEARLRGQQVAAREGGGAGGDAAARADVGAMLMLCTLSAS